MRITSLELNGFRAFAERAEFDLRADAIVVVGANGQGKTSLLDAILWAIAGDVPRLRGNEAIVSMYSDSGEARVALGLMNAGGRSATVVRSCDRQDSQLGLELDGETYRGPKAESNLLEFLWPRALAARDSGAALKTALQRGVYLEQDLVRDFIHAENDQERFASIGELVGAGRIHELQTALERSRNAWSRVTTARASEADELSDRLAALESRLAAGEAGPAGEGGMREDEWAAWWRRAAELGVTIRFVPPDALEAASALDEAVKELGVLQHALDRRRLDAVAVRDAITALGAPPQVDLNALREVEEVAAKGLTAARDQLAHAEQQASEIRRRQVETRQSEEELKAFAELALRHLADRCPVCEQTYDREQARKRLEAIARGDIRSTEASEGLPDVASLAKLVATREGEVATARRHVAEAESTLGAWQSRRTDLAARLTTLGIPTDSDAAALLPKVENELEETSAALSALRAQGERLALSLTLIGQRARSVELQREAEQLRKELARLRNDVRMRERTHSLASTIIDALREAGSDIVEEELKRLEPLVQRIYATADPHPTFRVVKLLSRMRQGRGRIVAAVADPHPEYRLERETPEDFLSSSQINVLAVSLFLALNLGMPALPLQTAILDDPLQSLDDLNLLGLVDLLRRMRQRRQLVISTHDASFGELLARKLRPVEPGQRTIRIDLEGWGRNGPSVRQEDVPADREPLRIARAA